MTLKYYAINKAYGVLSQFSEEGGHSGLGSMFDFPSDVYPVGRLDRDSEGLLLLTNDKSVNQKLLNPNSKRRKRYWAQVEHIPSINDLEALQNGVKFKAKGKEYTSSKCTARLIQPDIDERNPPIRTRKNIPTAWIELEISEGKNRQVRKMCAAIGHPCLRLVRVAIEDMVLDFKGVIELEKSHFYSLLNL
jgi:23S rRNA pseudouridine2457 synthase